MLFLWIDYPVAVNRGLPKLSILGKPFFKAVPEDTPIGSKILEVHVKDALLWHRSFNYSINGGGGIFSMNPSTGLCICH